MEKEENYKTMLVLYDCLLHYDMHNSWCVFHMLVFHNLMYTFTFTFLNFLSTGRVFSSMMDDDPRRQSEATNKHFMIHFSQRIDGDHNLKLCSINWSSTKLAPNSMPHSTTSSKTEPSTMSMSYTKERNGHNVKNICGTS